MKFLENCADLSYKNCLGYYRSFLSEGGNGKTLLPPLSIYKKFNNINEYIYKGLLWRSVRIKALWTAFGDTYHVLQKYLPSASKLEKANQLESLKSSS